MSALGHTTKCYTPTDLLNVASHSLFKLSGCRDGAKSARGGERLRIFDGFGGASTAYVGGIMRAETYSSTTTS